MRADVNPWPNLRRGSRQLERLTKRYQDDAAALKKIRAKTLGLLVGLAGVCEAMKARIVELEGGES